MTTRSCGKFVSMVAFLALAAFASCGDGVSPAEDVIGDSVTATDNGQQDIAAGDSVQDTVTPPGIVRFIFVSDIHFRVEDGDTKNHDDVETLTGMINALAGDFDILVTGGDNFDHVLPQWDDNPLESPMAWFTEQMDTLKMPWIAAIGNHEFYDYFGDVPTLTTDGQKRGQAFSTVVGTPLYFTREINGVKLIVLDSMEDGSWGETHGLMGKFSADQLDWLRAELAEGKPAFLFFHHPPSSMAPIAPGGHLCDVLEEYPGVVKTIFAGHTHGFWEGEYCGAPYYVVEDYHNQLNLWFEVEYDGASDTVTLLNEESIAFPEVPEFSCEPGESTIEDPESAVGTVQRMEILNGISDAEGLGEMLGEGLGAIPFVISFDGFDENEGYSTRLTIASRWDVDDFLTYVEDSPCIEMPLRWDDEAPCFEAGPFNMKPQLISFLASVSEDPVNPDWKAMLDIRGMVLEGCIRNSEIDNTPVIADGIVYATIVRDTTVSDMSKILVDEFCAERVDGCAPGENDLPECPTTIDQETYDSIFNVIRYHCDVQVMGFGLVSLIDMLETLPEETHVTGEVVSKTVTVSPTKEDGGDAADNLFDTDAGKNCSVE